MELSVALRCWRLFEGRPGAIRSSLAQNKHIAGEARGLARIRRSRLPRSGPGTRGPGSPETGLAVELGLSVPQEENSSDTLEMPHFGGPQAQDLNEEHFWKPNKNVPCQWGNTNI